MISRIEVRGFQSLVDVSLEVERFTVVVGRSSSGKSAVIRAFRALHTNSFAKEQITHGRKSGRITVANGSSTVVLERGASASYWLTQNSAEPVEYSKLGRSVPEAVQIALGISDIDLVFGNQFEKPYLLGESGSEVATVLGNLTNVSLIFTAAREAQRRKLENSSLLKTRLTDLALIVEQEKVFADLPKRLTGQQELEEEFSRAKEIEQQLEGLGAAIWRFQEAEALLVEVPELDLATIDAEFTRVADLAQQAHALSGAITRLQDAQDQLVDAPEPLELPSLDDAQAALQARDQFLNIFHELNRHKKDFTTANQLSIAIQTEIEGLISREHEILVAAGQCPLCGSEIK